MRSTVGREGLSGHCMLQTLLDVVLLTLPLGRLLGSWASRPLLCGRGGVSRAGPLALRRPVSTTRTSVGGARGRAPSRNSIGTTMSCWRSDTGSPVRSAWSRSTWDKKERVRSHTHRFAAPAGVPPSAAQLARVSSDAWASTLTQTQSGADSRLSRKLSSNCPPRNCAHSPRTSGSSVGLAGPLLRHKRCTPQAFANPSSFRHGTAGSGSTRRPCRETEPARSTLPLHDGACDRVRRPGAGLADPERDGSLEPHDLVVLVPLDTPAPGQRLDDGEPVSTDAARIRPPDDRRRG